MGDTETILGAISGLHEKIDTNSSKTHERIDGLVGSVGEVQVSMKGVQVSLDTVKKDVNGHLNDHKQSNKDVFKGVFTTVLTVAGILVAAWIIYEAGWK